MKAALLVEINALSVTEVATPACGKGEILVKVQVCGICRTDLKSYALGQRDLRLPRILGHEIAGTIAEVGKGVTAVKPGDRVQVSPGLPCGQCQYCSRGLNHLCDSIQVMGFHYDGGFAEYVLIPENGVKAGVLNTIPDHLPFAQAALTEPLACCINMQESIGIGPEDTLVIFGAGPLGILNAKLARMLGASKIILIETNKHRLTRASNFEFNHLINSLQQDPVSAVLELTKGMGADAVIPCCPGSEAFMQGISMLGKRGRFGFFSGLTEESPRMLTDFNLVHYKELIVSGAYGCSIQHNKEALRLLACQKISVRNIITRAVTLKEIEASLKLVAAMEELKIVINY